MNQMRTVLALALALGVSVWISAQTPVPDAAATSKTSCLGCHEYDRVIAATADYMMPGGDKISPHRYIDAKSIKDPAGKPHRVLGVENIPECTNCHTAHPVPYTGTLDRSTLKVTWCYSTCRHQENFTRCSECH
jgi:hypothetical protein